MSDLAYIDTYVDDPNIRRLLQAIRTGEGTADSAGYNRMFGGKQFADLSRHPAQVQRGGGYASDASGAYQFLSTTWGPLAAKYGLSDFSPRNQDRGAVALIREKIPDLGALSQQLQQNGLTPDVLDKLAPVWASLPTKAGKSYYGQPVKSLRELQAAFGQGPSGSSPALQPSLSAGQGGSDWLALMADELLKGSNVSTPEIELSSRRRPSSGDWLTEYANANLEQAAQQSRQSQRMAGSQGFIQALNSISPFRSGRSRRDMDLMLPEERQESQRAAIEAIQALMGGGGGQQGAANGIVPTGGALPLPQGAKPLTALTTVEGGKFGAARPGRTHLAWDFADEDGTGLMIKPDSGARWGRILPSSYGDLAELHTPEGSFRLIHGKKDRERGIYLQGGWGPSGPNAYAPHHDIAAIDPETGKQTGAFFPRDLPSKYLVSVRAR